MNCIPFTNWLSEIAPSLHHLALFLTQLGIPWPVDPVESDVL